MTTGYVVEVSAEGYEPTAFTDYATAMDYYNKLKQQGLQVEFLTVNGYGIL